MRSASAARQVVAEEHQLLGLLQADQAGEQVGAAAVGDEAAADEHLDEAGVLGRDDEVAASARCAPPPAAVPLTRDDAPASRSRGSRHQPLDPGADHAGRRRRRPARARPRASAGGAARPARSAPVQKCFSPAAVMHDGADVERAVGLVEELDDAVADVGRDRVAGVGPVQRDPRAPRSRPGAAAAPRRVVGHCSSPHSYHQGIEGDRAARPHDQRVDVELGDLAGEVERRAAGPS